MADQRPRSTRAVTLTGNGDGPSIEALREFAAAAISDGFDPMTPVAFIPSYDQRGERTVSWRLEAQEVRHHA